MLVDCKQKSYTDTLKELLAEQGLRYFVGMGHDDWGPSPFIHYICKDNWLCKFLDGLGAVAVFQAPKGVLLGVEILNLPYNGLEIRVHRKKAKPALEKFVAAYEKRFGKIGII